MVKVYIEDCSFIKPNNPQFKRILELENNEDSWKESDDTVSSKSKIFDILDKRYEFTLFKYEGSIIKDEYENIIEEKQLSLITTLISVVIEEVIDDIPSYERFTNDLNIYELNYARKLYVYKHKKIYSTDLEQRIKSIQNWRPVSDSISKFEHRSQKLCVKITKYEYNSLKYATSFVSDLRPCEDESIKKVHEIEFYKI
jgi:hypothetical protein